MKFQQVQLAALSCLTMASALAFPATEVKNSTDYANAYCTFYSDDDCTQQVGSVAYNVYNEGCFQNDGLYIMCSAAGGIDPEFILVQSPNNDDNCNCQNDCQVFPTGQSVGSPYKRCVAIDLNVAYSTYRIENGMTSCKANNC